MNQIDIKTSWLIKYRKYMGSTMNKVLLFNMVTDGTEIVNILGVSGKVIWTYLMHDIEK